MTKRYEKKNEKCCKTRESESERNYVHPFIASGNWGPFFLGREVFFQLKVRQTHCIHGEK